MRKQVESLSAAYTASKQQNQQSRSFTAADLTEAETRQKIIDIDLKAMGVGNSPGRTPMCAPSTKWTT